MVYSPESGIGSAVCAVSGELGSQLQVFLALLVVVVLFGNEIITVCAVIATIVSIGIYFVSLHPIIKKLDEMDEIQPKGYSKTLALTIGAFMVMFSAALALYFIL